MTSSKLSESGALGALREADPLRYAAVLYMPQEKRAPIASIWLFQSEIERIRDLVSEPLPGEIRLQWWRDVFLGMRDGEAKQNPLAVDLLETIDANGLSRDLFVTFLEAMTFDLYEDPMREGAQFEGHMGETQSVFFQMICQILAGERLQDGTAAGHAGVAFGVMRTLVDTAKHRARGQIYVPSNMLDTRKITADKWLASDNTAEKCDAIKDFTAFGLDHLAKANSALTDLPVNCRIAFLVLAVCGKTLERAREKPLDAFNGNIALGPLQTHWTLLKAALRGF